MAGGGGVIHIGEDMTLERDAYQWILTRYWDGKVNPKTGESKRQSKQTYHATLDQVAGWVLNYYSERCESLEDLRRLYSEAQTDIAVKLSTAAREEQQ